MTSTIKARIELGKYEVSKRIEKFWVNLAWLLPKQLVYWATIRLWVNAMHDGPPDSVSIDQAMKEWRA